MAEKVYIGIDLGTTNTLVYYMKKEKLSAFRFEGKKILPSVVYVDTENDNEIIVGSDAYIRGAIDPDNRVMSAKTYMATDKKYLFYTKDGKTLEYTPTDIAAEVLKCVKRAVMKKLKLTDEDEIYAVITTPAAFSFKQNEETINAAKKAGIKVLGTRPEPVAAVMACLENVDKNSVVFVVDIGGGTYDTAAIKFDENLEAEIISSEGNRQLGGDDFNKAVFEYIKERFEIEFGIDLSSQDSSELSYSDYSRVISTLYDSAREAKEEITRAGEYEIRCERICTIEGYNNDEPISFNLKIKEETFDKICAPIYKKIEDKLDDSIKILKNDKNFDIKDITDLILVGGSCYLKRVIEIIEKKVGHTAVAGTDKTTAVAEGAARIANSWTTIGQNIGGVLAQSMGVEVQGGKFSKIIEKNTKYPCSESKKYSTVMDNQKKVTIAVYAASPDKEDVEDINEHEFYACFELEVEEAKKGEPEIEIRFSFDNSQQLEVTAIDLKTNNEKSLKINRDIKSKGVINGKPMAIDILLDASGSMRGRKMDDAKNACSRLINEIVDLSRNYIGVTQFDDFVSNKCDMTNDADILCSGVYSISAGGGTNMDDGIEASSRKLINWQEEGYDKTIFLVTDGAPNFGDKSVDIAKEIRSKNIKLVVIYIGNSNDRGFNIAKDIAAANKLNNEENSLFYTTNDMSKLGDIFKRVYADIALAE